MLTPGVWHRIAMCVLWSQDPAVGRVDVWFDGEQAVTAAAAKTLADGNPHFAQIGLLRGNVDIDGVPVIYLDDVLEGDFVEDVDPPEEPGGSDSSGGDETGGSGGPGTGDTGTVDPSTSGASTDGGGLDGTAGNASTTSSEGSDTTGSGAADGEDGGGGSCRTRPEAASAWWLLLPGATAGVGRRRLRRARA